MNVGSKVKLGSSVMDSGLVVVVFIISCLLWVVGLLLFYDFENICDKAAARGNDSSSMVISNVGFQLALSIYNCQMSPFLHQEHND